MTIERSSFVWMSVWVLALCHLVQPKAPATPRPAVDDCECEAWDRISKNFTSDFVHCRRNADCAGTACSGKAPDQEIGAFNLSFHVYACRNPIALRVNLSMPSKTIDWTRVFEKSERVKVPGLQIILSQIRFSVYFQINITKEEAEDDVVLGVSLWGKTSVPSHESSKSVNDTWTEAMDLIEHQHLPLPKCRDGKPVPEPCGGGGGGDSPSPTSSTLPAKTTTTTITPSHSKKPSPVGRPCDFDSMITGCDHNEMCSQTSANLSICVCRPKFRRGEKGICVWDGGVTTTPGPMTSTSAPTKSPSTGGHSGAIGGTIGAILIVALLVALFWWWRRRRQTRLRIVRLYDDEEVLMRNDGYQPVVAQDDDNQII